MSSKLASIPHDLSLVSASGSVRHRKNATLDIMQGPWGIGMMVRDYRWVVESKKSNRCVAFIVR